MFSKALDSSDGGREALTAAVLQRLQQVLPSNCPWQQSFLMNAIWVTSFSLSSASSILQEQHSRQAHRQQLQDEARRLRGVQATVATLHEKLRRRVMVRCWHQRAFCA